MAERVTRPVWVPFSGAQPALNALSGCLELLGELGCTDRARVLEWLTDMDRDPQASWERPEPR